MVSDLLFATPQTAWHRASLSFTISWSLLKLMSVQSMMISNSVILYCSLLLPLIFPFLASRPFTSGSQSRGALSSASVLTMNTQSWFPLGLTGLILKFKGLSRVFFSTTIWKHPFLGTQPSLWFNSDISTWLLEKPELWLYKPLLAKWYFCFLTCCICLS